MINLKLNRLKNKATIIRKFLKDKCDVDISQGHGLELIARISGFKDWNTASAKLKQDASSNLLPIQITTVGEMKKALEAFDDTAMIDACYEFKLKDFEIEPLASPEDEISQEFSLFLEDFSDKHLASFKLTLEYESMKMDV